MTDALTTASRQSGRASSGGQLNTKEWGKLVWAVPPPSHAPLQAQSTNSLNRLRMCDIYRIMFCRLQLRMVATLEENKAVEAEVKKMWIYTATPTRLHGVVLN
jgi:hypothetical protein